MGARSSSPASCWIGCSHCSAHREANPYSSELITHISITYTDLEGACVAVLRPASALDWSSYHDLLAHAWAAQAAGAHDLIVDLSDVERVGSADMAGLYTVARLAQGTQLDAESGWAALRALVEGHPPLRPLAVVHPHSPVRQALASAPFSNILAIHADLDTALAALAEEIETYYRQEETLPCIPS